MSSSQDSKLVATAVGAAAVGAALAVMAMKMTEHPEEKNKVSELNIVRPRVSRTSLLMNDFTDDYEGGGGGGGGSSLKPDDSASNLIFPHNHEEKMRRRIATRYQIEDENSAPRESVTVRVPATSANVGPGCTYPCVHVIIIIVCRHLCVIVWLVG